MTKIQNVGADRAAPYVAGDHLDLLVSVVDAAGEPYDLSDVTAIRYVIAPKAGGTPLIEKALSLGITIVDGQGGQFRVTLESGATAGMTGVYAHEAEVIDAASRVATVFKGTIAIQPEIILAS